MNILIKNIKELVQVEEQDIIGRITMPGLEHVSESTVRDTANLQASQPYSPARILRAKGAAAAPPWPPCSTKTATAICGSSTGAKVTNQAWFS